MKRAGVSESEVSHVSTGGSATLRFLAGDEMRDTYTQYAITAGKSVSLHSLIHYVIIT
jgi:hypothetical protein